MQSQWDYVTVRCKPVTSIIQFSIASLCLGCSRNLREEYLKNPTNDARPIVTAIQLEACEEMCIFCNLVN